MKKPKRLKKPTIPKLIKRPIKGVSEQLADRRAKSAEDKVSDALSNVPRITNETVSEHREEVLSSARKFIYPLQHSKHRIVRISLALLAVVIISFFAIVTLSLYKFQSTGGFIYDVTRIVPYPVAKAGSDWVSYEAYLFELRRNMHYYKTQQQANFSSEDGKTQLQRLKKQAMAQVVEDAYVKRLAKQNDITVTNEAVDNQVKLVREQNRLGNNDRVFREVLKEFWGWSEADFRRVLKQQLLKQEVVSQLDSKANQRAQDALTKLNSGADFAALAKEVSDDAVTKDNGGQYPAAIRPNERELSPAITAELFKLKPGQTSAIINTGYSLEIVRVNSSTADNVQASHIQFNLIDINSYIKPLQADNPSSQYIKF